MLDLFQKMDKTMNHGEQNISPVLKPGLYIVPTPIGNLSDITLRAIHTLQSAAAIYCENTNHSIKLLSHYQISTPLAVYNDHSNSNDRHKILRRSQREAIALISDAGMPLISDPGYKLVQEAYANDIYVTVLPGPCAVITAIALSGMPTDCFTFLGFFDASRVINFKDTNTTLAFYESPKRLVATLQWICDHMSDRTVSVCRELSKHHEENCRGEAAHILAHFQARDTIKGEYVIMLSPPRDKEYTDGDILNLFQDNPYHLEGKNLIAYVSDKYNIPRRRVYQVYHQ
ncbi:MAG: 16S rRNA (cytidine(1402)-2'-O)-methyltransferase [Alphaproteobacteria bacterium]|nr:16S rRNA (cytidine(1402)-2'-O)-methyltransferase [Alphaproteobacteria bacterium]